VCGIAGVIGKPGEVIYSEDVHRMCQTIVHRGPDDEGIYTQGAVGLGVRRLSIIDVAGGQQPIHNEDSTVWVVFNGEIYNFQELRRELESRGHRFSTQNSFHKSPPEAAREFDPDRLIQGSGGTD